MSKRPYGWVLQCESIVDYYGLKFVIVQHYEILIKYIVNIMLLIRLLSSGSSAGSFLG